MSDHDLFAGMDGDADHDPFLDDTNDGRTTTHEAQSKTRVKKSNYTEAFKRKMTGLGFHVHNAESTGLKTSRVNGELVTMPGNKRDLFGFADWVAIHRDLPGTTYIQVCRLSDVTNRLRKACTHAASEMATGKKRGQKKLLTNENRVVVLNDLLLAGNRFWIFGYEKVGRNWQPTMVNVTLDVVRDVTMGQRPYVAKLPKVRL